MVISFTTNVTMAFAFVCLRMAQWDIKIGTENVYRLFRSLSPAVSTFAQWELVLYFFSVPYRGTEIRRGTVGYSMWSYVMCALTVIIPVLNRNFRASPGTT